MKEFKLIKLLEAIRIGIEEVQAKRVVIDPITIFTLQYSAEVERIYAMRLDSRLQKNWLPIGITLASSHNLPGFNTITFLPGAYDFEFSIVFLNRRLRSISFNHSLDFT